MENSPIGTFDLWMFEGVTPLVRDPATSAANKQNQTLGEWMTQAICDRVQLEPQPASTRHRPDLMISEADSTAYQSDLAEQGDICNEIARTINDHEVCLPGNRGDASAEPPRFD
jgi:hypothetical protein